MKILFRPIFIIFFVVLDLSFSLSMRRTSQQYEQNQEVLLLIQEETQRLQLQEQNLKYQLDIVSRPTAKEQIRRNQEWVLLPGETALQLNGFTYRPRPLVVAQASEAAIIDQWTELLL